MKVWDANGADLPEAASADPWAESGRGLLLTEELSDRWGAYRARPTGKVVWAVLAGRR